MAATPAAKRPDKALRGRQPEQNFRFYDNRRKYLMPVNICSEKWVVAERATGELGKLVPPPSAVPFFDACMGDGTVLARLMRFMHRAFPRYPFLIAGKETSVGDVRLMLDKMPGRFLEHAKTVLAISRIATSTAGEIAR